MRRISIAAMGLSCPLGCGLAEIRANLCSGMPLGLYDDDAYLPAGRRICLGHAPGSADHMGTERPERQPGLNTSRNNRLLHVAWLQIAEAARAAMQDCGPERMGIVLGTSTSGLAESDRYISALARGSSCNGYCYTQQEPGDPSRFLAGITGITGPCYTISTACTSSSQAVISAMALLEAGIIDAALAGGCDTLNRMTVSGFDAMGLLSPVRCMPFCRDRCGITVSEAAGLVLLSRGPGDLCLAGAGQGSDAYHITAPHPAGRGTRQAIRRALSMAGLGAEDIGYISLHGTGTQANDAAEARAVGSMFPATPCSSVKYLTGHALGAAGICALILAALILQADLPLPPQDFERSPRDESLYPCTFAGAGQRIARDFVLCNTCAFGGSCTALIVGRG